MCLLQVALDAFGTHHPLVEGKLVPRLHADDEVVLDLQLHPTLLAAEAAVCLDVLSGSTPVRPAVSRVGEVRAKFTNGLPIEWWVVSVVRAGPFIWSGAPVVLGRDGLVTEKIVASSTPAGPGPAG